MRLAKVMNIQKAMQKELKVLSGSFDLNSTSDPAAVKGKGFAVTRLAAGVFQIALERSYVDLISALATLQLASADDKYCQLATYNPTSRSIRVRVADKSVGFVDEIQKISFGAVPTSGSWTITFDGQTTSSLAFNANATAVQTALRALTNLSTSVTVTGDYTSGFTITFVGVAGLADRSALTVTSSLALKVAEVQTISFSAVPDAGSWTIGFGGQTTSVLAFNANATAVQTALRALSTLSSTLTVTGDYTGGLVVTFLGSAIIGIDQPLLTINNINLENTHDPVLVTIVETTPGAPGTTVVTISEDTKGIEGVDVAPNANNRVNFKLYLTRRLGGR